MADQKHDDGIMLALLDRFSKYRLPRLLDIQKTVKNGQPLSDMDIYFLDESLATASRIQNLVDRNPDYEMLYCKIITLYKDITNKALENETKA